MIISRYYPPRLMLDPPDEGGGGGGATPEVAPGGLGTAFAGMLQTLGGEEGGDAAAKAAAAAAAKETPPAAPPAGKKPGRASAVEKPTPAAKPAAAAATPPAAAATPPAADATGIPAGVIEPAAAPAAGTPPAKTPPAEPAAAAAADEITKGMSDGARANFKKMQDAHAAKVADLTREIEALKTGGAGEAASIKTQLEKVQQENKELLDVVEKIGLERSPQFTRKFIKGREELIGKTLAKVTEVGGDGDAFKKALGLSGKARFEAMEHALVDVPEMAKAQIAGLVGNLETIDAEKDAVLAKSRETLTDWERQQLEQAEQQRQQMGVAQRTRFTQLLDAMSGTTMMLRKVPAETPGADQWNATVDEIVKGGETLLFETTDWDQFAAASIRAKAYEKLEPMFKQTHALLAEANKRIAELTAAEPGTSNGGGSHRTEAAAAATGADGKPLSFAQRVAAAQKGE